MTIRTLLFAAGCVAAVAGSPALAAATIIPATYYEVHIADTTTGYDVPGTYSSTHGSVTTQASPMPALRTQAAVGDAREDATAYMRYYYRINGPDNVLVPVSLAGMIHLLAQAGDTAQANSYGQVDLPTPFTSDSAHIEIDRGGTNRSSVSDLTFDLHGTVYTNGWNSVILHAGTVAGGSRLDGASGSAYVDPILRIDPSFFTASNPQSLYSLSFSNGIVNGLTGAVPEPATWAMLILGFGMVGGAMRRRRTMGMSPSLA